MQVSVMCLCGVPRCIFQHTASLALACRAHTGEPQLCAHHYYIICLTCCHVPCMQALTPSSALTSCQCVPPRLGVHSGRSGRHLPAVCVSLQHGAAMSEEPFCTPDHQHCSAGWLDVRLAWGWWCCLGPGPPCKLHAYRCVWRTAPMHL